MSLNCAEIDLILRELDLQGAFIQKVAQSSYDTLTLALYKQGALIPLFFCFAPNFTRLHSASQIPPKTEKPLRFQEFMKSRFVGARINRAAQIGEERIVRFDVSKPDEKGEVRDFVFFVRLWSNAANFVVTDSNLRVLDAFFRRPAKGEIPCGKFCDDFPQSQGGEKKFFPRDLTSLLRAEGLLQQGENPSFNRAVELWYSECAGKLSRTALLEQAERDFLARKSRIEKAIFALQKKKENFSRASELQKKGNLILSNMKSVEKSLLERKKFAECPDFETGENVKIALDAEKTASENAAQYFKEYKKAVSGAGGLERDIQILKAALAKAQREFDELKSEKNPISIQRKMKKASARKAAKNDAPGLRYEISGWTILVGRSAAENDELLRRHVRGSDLWLHVRDFAGGYVFIKAKSKAQIPPEILLDAATLAIFYSKARKNGKADIYCAPVKNLRRAKGAPKGTVLPSNEKNIFASLDEKRLQKIEDAAKNLEI